MQGLHRRVHERVYPGSERVAWGSASGGTLGPAKVRDSSISGIGLQIDGTIEAGLGEMIRVISPDEEYPRRARIIHMETLTNADGMFPETTVGCRWVTGVDHRQRRAESLPSARRHHQASTRMHGALS